MAELYDVISDIVKEVVKNMDVLDTSYATVVSTSPLTLEIQATHFRVKEPVAVLSDAVKYRSVTVQGETIVVNPGISKGDKVLAIKANAGQNYIVISKA